MTDRYQRHSLIDWFDQTKLQDSTVIVVGAGAVGNEVLKNLSLLGIGNLHIVDFDIIEEHNLTRSVLFQGTDIGSHKAQVAAASCKKIDPNVSVKATSSDFWDALTLNEIAKADAVICCVDNFEARISLNKLCLMTSTDFINTGIDSRYGSVEIFPFSSNPDCSCFECSLPISAYEAIERRYSCGWLKKIAFKEKKIPTTAITASITGSIAVSLILNRLNNHKNAIDWSARYFIDTISLETTLSKVIRNDNCVTCGSIDPNAQHITAKNSCGSDKIIPLLGPGTGEIILSEPILIRGICKLCNREQKIYESARKLNDNITFCSYCGKQSISTEFVETLTVDDFTKIFNGKDLPCKFIILNSGNHQLIIEMED